MPVTLRAGSTALSAAVDLSATPRVALSLALTTGTVPDSAVVTRLDPDGVSRVVRLAEPAQLVRGVWSGFDYEAPFGQPVKYTATSDVRTVSSPTALLDVRDVWLRHPGVPELSMRIDRYADTVADEASVASEAFDTRSRDSTRAMVDVLNGRSPIVVTGRYRKTPETTLLVRTRTDAERRRLWALLEDDSVLLLTVPPALGWGVGSEYVSIGTVTEKRVLDYGPEPSRLFSLPYTVVNRPAGDLVPLFTIGDLRAAYRTIASVRAAFPTVAALTRGRT